MATIDVPISTSGRIGFVIRVVALKAAIDIVVVMATPLNSKVITIRIILLICVVEKRSIVYALALTVNGTIFMIFAQTTSICILPRSCCFWRRIIVKTLFL